MEKNTSGFTLIELIVSVTILSIVMISIFFIFQLSADLNNKTDISRSMQENIKNIVETIAEDVRKQGISGVNNSLVNPDCDFSDISDYTSGTKLCLGNVSYYIAKEVSGSWNRVFDYSNCDEKTQCFLIKNDGINITPLSNSWVDFKTLDFYISKDGSKKVTLNFLLQPSKFKGIKPELIEENKIVFQTTLSERLYSDY